MLPVCLFSALYPEGQGFPRGREMGSGKDPPDHMSRRQEEELRSPPSKKASPLQNLAHMREMGDQTSEDGQGPPSPNIYMGRVGDREQGSDTRDAGTPTSQLTWQSRERSSDPPDPHVHPDPQHCQSSRLGMHWTENICRLPEELYCQQQEVWGMPRWAPLFSDYIPYPKPNIWLQQPMHHARGTAKNRSLSNFQGEKETHGILPLVILRLSTWHQ